LPGCTITLTVWIPANGIAEPTVATTTGDDGCFTLLVDPLPARRYLLQARGTGRVPREGTWTDLAANAVLDIGDIELARGAVVAGIAVDRDSHPVAGIVLRLKGMESLPLRGSISSNSDDFRATSAEDGRFTFEGAVPQGNWDLDTITAGLGIAEPKRVSVPAAVELRVLVTRFGRARGIALDQRGAPAASATLYARRAGTDEAIGATRVGKDGSFTLFAGREGLTEFDVVAEDPRFTLDAGPLRVRVGEEGLRLLLTRAAELEILVIDSASREPVQDYAIYHARRGRSSSEDLGRPQHHDGGRAIVEGLSPGRHLLRIVPTDSAFAVSEPFVLEVDATAPALRTIELVRRIRRDVRVIDAHGNAVGGSRLLLEANRIRQFALTPRDPRTGFSGYDSEWKVRRPEVLDKGVVAPDGTASLLAAPVSRGLVLRVEGESHLPTEVVDIAFDPGAPAIEVRVSKGGALTGHVVVPAQLTSRTRIDARPIDIALPRDLPAAPVEVDGTFRIRALPPATWELRAVFVVPARHGGLGNSRELRPTDLLGQVRIGDGETAHVELDLARFAPGRASGRVAFDGVSREAIAVELFGMDATRVNLGEFALDDGGRWTAELVLPGRYAVSVGVLDGGQLRARCIDPAPLVVAPGAEAMRDVAFAHRTLRGRLLDASEAPCADQLLQFLAPDGRTTLAFVRTGADGRFVLDPAPIGTLQIQSQGVRLDRKELVVPNEAGEQNLELRAGSR